MNHVETKLLGTIVRTFKLKTLMTTFRLKSNEHEAIYFVTTSNALQYYFNVVFLFYSFLVITVRW